MMLLLFFF